MPKFAANISMMFTDLPFLDRFEAAAQAGFKAVEFLFPYDYPASVIAEELTRNGLQQVLFNTTAGDINAGQWGRAALPGLEQDARSDIDTALEYAIALNCTQVHVMAGVVPTGEERSIYLKTFISNLRYAAERFNSHNKRVLIEALSPGVKPHYLFSSQYQALEIVEAVNAPNLFIQLDLFHAQKVDGNLSRLIRDYKDRYAHVQIASLPDRHEPDDGEINYPWIFNLFDEVDYSGFIGCEYKPRAETTAGLDWLKPYL